MFQLTIDLTPSGMANWVYVVAIIYKYLDMLLASGPQEWVSEELRQMGEVNFGRFDVY